MRRARKALVARRKLQEQRQQKSKSDQQPTNAASMLALEPRIVFDAAAAATVDQTADQVAEQQASDAVDSPSNGDSHTTEPTASGDDFASVAVLEENRREIAFVDGSVENVDELIQGINPSVEVVMLDSNTDGVEQIASVLENHDNIDALHIISHGDEGALHLGNTTLDADSMQGQHLDELTIIRDALTDDGDILIYGCDFTDGESGLEAAILLGSITEADIAASDDLTGLAERGGDWDLETEVGNVETDIAVNDETAENWDGLLADTVLVSTDFETGTTTGHVAAPFEGWSSDDGFFELWVEPQNGWTTPNGTVYIELNEDPSGNFPNCNDIFRNIPTDAGAQYEITFIYAGRPGYDATVNAMTVSVDGSVVGTYSQDATALSDHNWITETVTFVGNGSPMEVSFDSTGVPTEAGRGMRLDSIQITQLNRDPTAVDDSYSTNEDITLNIPTNGVLGNDSDIDGDTITVASHTAPSNGSVTVNPDGSFSYTPNADFNGTDSFTYTVSDGHGGTATATVTITVTPVNDGPVAVDDSFTTAEDTTSTVIDLLGNDSDVDGDTITVQSINGTTITPGTAQTIVVTNGTVNVSATGDVTFTPDPDYNGPISFDYVISDGNGGTDTGTVNGTVTPVSDAPVAVDDTINVTEDSVATFNPLTNDSDAESDVFMTSFTSPANGDLQLEIGESDSVTVDSNGTTITLDRTYTNPVVFAFITTENEDASQAVIARVTNVTGNSFDLALVEPNSGVATDPTDGIHGNETVSYIVLEAGTWTLSDGTVVEVGTHDVSTDAASFTNVSFDHTFSSSPAVISQVQTNTNNIDFNNSRQHIVTSTGFNVTNEPADYQSSSITSAETIGYIAIDRGTGEWSGMDFEAGVTGDNVTHVDNAISFTNNLGPDVNFFGQLNSFDGGDNSHLDAHSVTGSGATINIQEDQTTDAETAHTTETASWFALGGDGILTAASGSNFSIASSDVDFQYTPQDDVYGVTETFTYTISDSDGQTDTATVTLNITAEADTVTDNVTTPEDTPVSFNVLSNDGFEGNVALTAISAPSNGSISFDAAGNVTYTPNADFHGTETLTYTITEDDQGVTETGTIEITVTPVNDPPVAVDDSFTTAEDTTSAVIDLLGNDS